LELFSELESTLFPWPPNDQFKAPDFGAELRAGQTLTQTAIFFCRLKVAKNWQHNSDVHSRKTQTSMNDSRAMIGHCGAITQAAFLVARSQARLVICSTVDF